MPLPPPVKPRRPGPVLTALVLACVVLAALVACGDRAGVLASFGSATGTTEEAVRGPLAGLDPDLRHAFASARADAARDGVELRVTSGWRSAEHQQRLFDDAVARYGSEDEASRWVARPGTSVHEAGDAIDVGPTAGALWLEEHGAGFGLCRVYDNELWHFELRPDAEEGGCPATYADPSQDPRLQRG